VPSSRADRIPYYVTRWRPDWLAGAAGLEPLHQEFVFLLASLLSCLAKRADRGFYGAGLRVASSARAVLRHCLLVPGLVSRTGTEPTIIEAIDSYLVIPRSEGLSTGSYPR
jgi:hypothetical protein